MQLSLSALWIFAFTSLSIPTLQIPFPLMLKNKETVNPSIYTACTDDCMAPLHAKSKECSVLFTTMSWRKTCMMTEAAATWACFETCVEMEALDRYIPGSSLCQLKCLMTFRRRITRCTEFNLYRIPCLRAILQECFDCEMDCHHDDRLNLPTELVNLTIEGCDRNCQTNDLRRRQMCSLVVPNLRGDCMDVADSLSYGCSKFCDIRFGVDRRKPQRAGAYRVCLRLGKARQGAFVDNGTVYSGDNYIWC